MGTQHILRCRNVGFAGAVHLLQVRNNTAGLDNNEFAPPSESGGGLDGSIDVAVPIPVTSNEIHVRANHDAAVMYFDGTTRDIEAFLHIDIAWVQWSLVLGDERVQSNDLLAMAQGLEVIGFNAAPSLLIVSSDTVKERSQDK